MQRRKTPFWNLDAEFAADLQTSSGGREQRLLLALFARLCLWVDPEVARLVPVVYPRTARLPFGRGRQGSVRKGIRYWTNQPSESAFFAALGTTPSHFGGLVVCHIYPGSPRDPRHFTRLSNLVVVPKSLAAFTEWAPVLEALQWRAFELYSYAGPSGKPPARPAVLPQSWAGPSPLDGARRAKIVARLRHLRATRPMYSTPGGRGPPRWGDRATMGALSAEFPWSRLEGELGRGRRLARVLTKDARDLDAEFWQQVLDDPALTATLVGWVVRHAYFAPSRVVAAVANPFPKTRRARWWRGEREGQVKNGITLSSNGPAWTALIVAVGGTLRKTRGGLVDHPWPDASYLPHHNAHLGGLVLVPRALATLVDAAPVRALLQRRLFERTGYRGPGGVPPATVPWAPCEWPELVHLPPEREAGVIATLRHYLETKPGYYRPWRPGGPGRPPRKR